MKASRLLLVLAALAAPAAAEFRGLPPPSLPQTAVEASPGTYRTGPVAAPFLPADPALLQLAQVPRVALSIHKDFIEPMGFDAIMERAVNGAVIELGPRSTLAPQEAMNRLRVSLVPPAGGELTAAQAVLRSVGVLRSLWDGDANPVETGRVVEASLKFMLGTLDDHSRYFNSAEFPALLHQFRGSNARLGVEFAPQEQGPRSLTKVVPGSAAEAAGLRVGDEVVAVDGTPVAGLSLPDFRALLRKPELAFTIMRPGETGRLLEARVARAFIKPPDVLSSRLLPGGAGYLRIDLFQNDAAEPIQLRLLRLLEAGARGIILDLRGNPGGEQQTALQASSLFLRAGQVVARFRDRRGTAEAGVAEDGELAETPTRVLVDEGTMSASELLAGALQDNGQARLVGRPTYGKGTGQRIYELGDGTGYKFTVDRWQTPKGTQLNHEAGTVLVPDLRVEGKPGDDGADPVLERAAADLVK